MRLFIATSVPDTVKTLLGRQQRDLQAVLPGETIRWADPATTHLTLIFLGNVSAPNLGVVRQGLDFACRRVPPFELHTSGLGAFPSSQRPSVLWTGVAGEIETLQGLHTALVRQLNSLYQDERVFKPHLTLGRVTRFGRQTEVTEALTNMPDYAPVAWRVDRVGVYSSTLKPSGAVHDLLHETSL